MDYVRPMLDICLIMEPNFTNLEDLACLESQEFAFLLGNAFSTNADIDAIKKFSSSILWFTYRRNWTAPIGGFGGPTSDRGWGCMVRCGQMLLAQCLSLIHLGPKWRWNASKYNQDESIALRYRKLLRMFQDKRTAQYSIHQITQMAVSEGKQISEWLGPNTMAQVLKKLVIYDEWSNLVVHVAMDNILISSDVWVVATQKSQKGLQNEKQNEEENNLMDWMRPLLLLIPLRLGLTAINSCYLEAIAEFFKLQECVGILGGRPNHAVYFYGAVGEKLLYLDPHVCQEFKDLDEHPATGVKEPTDIKCEDGSLLGVSSTNSSEHLTQSIQSMNTNDATNSTSNQNLSTEEGANSVTASSSTNSYISSPYCSNSSSNCSLVEQQKNSVETASSSFPTSISKLSSRSEDFQSNSSSPEPEMPMDSLMDNSIESFADFNSNRPNSIARNENNGEEKQGKDDLFGSNQSMKQESSSSNAFDDSTFHCPYLLSMDFKSLDPSLALGFLVRNSNEYKNLVQSLKENILTKSSPPLFEILEERPRGWPKFSLETSYLQDESFNIKEYEDLQYDSDEQFELLE